jgi:hypothetical protein
MDYGQWVERLRRFILALRQHCPADQRENFVVEIAPPLDEDDLEELAGSLDCGLPEPLHQFLATGASGISFQYAWPSPDEETSDAFCLADKLVQWRQECIEYAQESCLTEPDWPLDYAFWRHALPLVHYPDGDGVALWVHDPEQGNPPVIYLKHDEESFLLSRSFDEFLGQWERLGYVGTNDLGNYRNPQTGFLDATITKAVALRERLGLGA